MTLGLISKAGDMVKATSMAYSSMEFNISNQATVLTYIDTFQYLGVFFILVIPIIFLAKDTAAVSKEDMEKAGH
jgi:DHA2 family multidrug resistance protein